MSLLPFLSLPFISSKAKTRIWIQSLSKSSNVVVHHPVQSITLRTFNHHATS